MTVGDHADAIAAAIQAAHNDGFQLDNGDGEYVRVLDLNEVKDNVIRNWVAIDLPAPTYI